MQLKHSRDRATESTFQNHILFLVLWSCFLLLAALSPYYNQDWMHKITHEIFITWSKNLDIDHSQKKLLSVSQAEISGMSLQWACLQVHNYCTVIR